MTGTPSTPAPRSGIARLALIRHAPERLAELGADADSILALVGLERADFLDPEKLIPYALLERLLLECERQTGCDHFGLLLCRDSRLEHLGLPGRAARCEPTVGEGLRALVRAYNIRRGGGIVDLVTDAQYARFLFAMATPGTHDTRHYQMGAVTIIFNVLEDLCGPDWSAVQVHFAFRGPANDKPFQRYFRAPLRFDEGESAVTFATNWLSRPLPPVDESLRKSVAAELRATRNRAFEDFPGLVRDLIRKRLTIGPCSIAGVSATLAMHRRTLDRRLARSGEHYGALLKSVRYEIGQQLLRETNLSVQEIADHLQFASAASFATAFRQWSGRTPSQYREQSA